MRCEVVAIGSELLLGQIVDTNSAWIGEQLALAGIDSLFQVKVGDNHRRIVRAIRDALARADAVICCGGLGPTQDDITRAAIAEVMGVELVTDEHLVEVISEMFARRGREMASNNLLQAQVPVGAEIIPQTRGTAPGLVCEVGDRVIYAVPGVPAEMREMVERAILPDLIRRNGDAGTIASRTLRTWGLAESTLAEMVAVRLEELEEAGNPTIAFLASGMEGIKVRVTAKAQGPDAQDEAKAVLDREEAELRSILGDRVFAVDDDNMESTVAKMLTERDMSLALAESLTGGLMASRLCAVPGASGWFKGSLVTYGEGIKQQVLGLPEGPVITAQAAEEMSVAACRMMGADVGLAVTGVAGPDESEGQRVGTVWVGLTIRGVTESKLLRLGSGSRQTIREMTAINALDVLRRRLSAF